MPITKMQSSRDFFRVWFLRERTAVAAFFIIVGLIMFYAYTATPVYESSAKVLLLPKTHQDLVITARSEGEEIRPVEPEDINTEIELITSEKVIADTVRSFPSNEIGLQTGDKGLFDRLTDGIVGSFNAVLNIFRLKGEPLSPFERNVELLKKNLTVEPAYESNVVLMNVRSENAEASMSALDTLLQIYIDYHNNVFSIAEGLGFYDDQAEMYKMRLEEAEKELKDFQENWSIVDMQNQNLANIGLNADLTKGLHLLEIEYDQGKKRIEILQKVAEENKDQVIVTKEMRTIPAIVELEENIVPLLIKQTEVAKRYLPTSREYSEITTQIEKLNDQLKIEIQKALHTDMLELETLGARKQSLRKKIEQLSAKTMDLKEKERTLEELQRKVAIHKESFLTYSSKREDSRIHSERKSRNLTNVVIVDKPTVPVRPVSPDKLVLLLVALFLGTTTAIFLPFALEKVDRKIKTADDVEALLSLQVVSSFLEVK